MIKIFDDADGVMFVSMGYEFIKRQFLLPRDRAFIRIKLWNKEGKKWLVINEFGISKVCWHCGWNTTNCSENCFLCVKVLREVSLRLVKKILKVSRRQLIKLDFFKTSRVIHN